MRTLRQFKDLHIDFLKDSNDAKAYLSTALESFEQDSDKNALSLALRDVAEAQGVKLVDEVKSVSKTN